MKAIQIKERNGEKFLEYETFPTPQLKGREVLIQVKACGVNRLDLLVLQGQMGIPLPHIPGSDVSGVVQEIHGESNLVVGQAVVVNPAMPCNDCPRCRRGLSCGSVGIFGYKTPGGYAEYVTAPTEQVYPKPENLSHIEAASFPLTFLTAYHMLAGRADLQRGERAFIWGASGGLGSAGVQIAKHLGAEVIAAAGTREDAERIKAMGADHVINYRKENVVERVQELTDGEKVEVVFENVGQKTWDTSLAMLAPYGRLVTAGATTGTDVSLNIRDLYRYQHTLLGALMGTKKEFEQVLKLVGEGKLKPTVDQVFPLEQVGDALKRMEESKQTGNIVLKI